jgi:hypothetical protein
MSSGTDLQWFSDWGITESHIHGHWILNPMVMIAERVIFTISRVWHISESSMTWCTDRTSQRQWYTRFSSVVRTVWSSLRSMETSYGQWVRVGDWYQGSDIMVRLCIHSSNTILPTDTKWTNSMKNKVQLRSPWVLVRVQFHFMLDDYCDEYVMMSMINRFLVNRI